MRKTKVELNGFVIIKDKKIENKEIDIYKLGETLLPSFWGMLDSDTVNNRMFIIEMQRYVKLQYIFHYQTETERVKKIKNYLKQTEENLVTYLNEHRNIKVQKSHLDVKIISDVDYCSLPLEEAKNDLSTQELLEIMSELKNYHPTTIQSEEKRGQNVFF